MGQTDTKDEQGALSVLYSNPAPSSPGIEGGARTKSGVYTAQTLEGAGC